MLPTNRNIELIEKKKLVTIAFDLDYKVFVTYCIATLNIISDISDQYTLQKGLKKLIWKEVRALQKFLVNVLILQLFFH